MNKLPKVSIIIPLYAIESRFFNDLKKFKELDYSDYEIIIISDKQVDIKEIPVKFFLTDKKHTGPAEKRDVGLKYAKGEICAFIDDDAYPDKNWLKSAVRHFQDESIVAVGGPGVTPREDPYWAQISGMIYESFFCSGAALHRFIPQSARYVEDYPAYNLIVRTHVLKLVGGYSNTFYGGEDTFLCLKLIKLGKIYYEPDAIVYHHRRNLFFGLLKQIGNVGLHRGYFAKKFPQTSRRPIYFLPSLLTLGFVTIGILSLVSIADTMIFLLILLGFIVIGVMSVNRSVRFIDKILVGIGIILVHIVYGINFIKGLAINELKK